MNKVLSILYRFSSAYFIVLTLDGDTTQLYVIFVASILMFKGVLDVRHIFVSDTYSYVQINLFSQIIIVLTCHRRCLFNKKLLLTLSRVVGLCIGAS